MAYMADQAQSLIKHIYDSFGRSPFPQKGMSADDTVAELNSRHSLDPDLHEPKFFALVYPTGNDDVEKVVSEANKLHMWGNALNMLKLPQLLKMEYEVTSMVGDLLNMPVHGGGSITSGGTESILMSMLVNRERARLKGIDRPQILAPYSAHPAYAKAAHLFGMERVQYAIGPDYKADVRDAQKLISAKTAVIVASAMSFPHSVIDPVEEIARLAADHGIGCHVDACVGGFVLPFMERLGYDLPPWDFRVEGVTEISCDLHKFGYSTKGASVILHRDPDWMDHQFFLFEDWPSGLYGTPTLSGARPSSPIAASWAVLNHLGAKGYTELIKKALDATQTFKEFIEQSEDFFMVGDPVGPMLAFGSQTLDIARVGDMLSARGWHMDRNVQPPSLHAIFSPAHKDVVEDLINDLQDCAGKIKG